MRKGKVYLVGAGPGDPGLLTVRAAALLSRADIVLYDRLVGPDVLKLVPSGARKVYAGKSAGSGDTQDGINERMVSEARKGRTVVRLKGGDPFIFGRGGEEMEFLRRNHTDFEVVPGVSSSLAGPAYAGIPLTHRDHSSSVLIMAGRDAASRRKRAPGPGTSPLAADTVVIMMGAATISETAKRLIEGGLGADVPVAAIEWATTKRQKTRMFRLGSLAAKKGREAIEPPSVIVVGAVASLAEKLDWFRVGGKTTLEPVERPQRNSEGRHGRQRRAMRSRSKASQSSGGSSSRSLSDASRPSR
ncbi:MAG: uroporphyrinogen-III C-methyltransferase [Nitrososphaerales archaeon]